MGQKQGFAGGRNIAMKVPVAQYAQTVEFYRDVLGLPEITEHAPHVVFAFGANQLWIDRTPGVGQSEVWLELVTDDAEAAAHLEARGYARQDDLEPLPDGFQAFWISNPAAVVHLVNASAAAQAGAQ